MTLNLSFRIGNCYTLNVFYQCPAITEIDIPANVTKMSEYSVCDNANTVTINAPKGSYAENYVKSNGKTNKLEFKAVEE